MGKELLQDVVLTAFCHWVIKRGRGVGGGVSRVWKTILLGQIETENPK